MKRFKSLISLALIAIAVSTATFLYYKTFALASSSIPEEDLSKLKQELKSKSLWNFTFALRYRESKEWIPLWNASVGSFEVKNHIVLFKLLFLNHTDPALGKYDHRWRYWETPWGGIYDKEAHTGRRCWKGSRPLISPDPEFFISVSPNTTFKFVFWMKLAEGEEPKEIRIPLFIETTEGASSQVEYAIVSKEWRKYEFVFKDLSYEGCLKALGMWDLPMEVLIDDLMVYLPPTSYNIMETNVTFNELGYLAPISLRVNKELFRLDPAKKGMCLEMAWIYSEGIYNFKFKLPALFKPNEDINATLTFIHLTPEFINKYKRLPTRIVWSYLECLMPEAEREGFGLPKEKPPATSLNYSTIVERS